MITKGKSSKIWRAEPRFVQLAERRTHGILAAWSNYGLYTLSMLCSSCYLQGVSDAFRAGEIESKRRRK